MADLQPFSVLEENLILIEKLNQMLVIIQEHEKRIKELEDV